MTKQFEPERTHNAKSFMFLVAWGLCTREGTSSWQLRLPTSDSNDGAPLFALSDVEEIRGMVCSLNKTRPVRGGATSGPWKRSF
jgi:hypothetical protein